MPHNSLIAFVLSLLTSLGIVSCPVSDPPGTDDKAAGSPVADSTPPTRSVAPPHEEDPTFTGSWEGRWDGQWRAFFEFGPQKKNGTMEVTYRWEELPGRPMNERRYIGYFSHGDVHLEPAIKTPRKKKITLVKIYPSDGETGIFAVGKFGKSRVTRLTRVPAAARQE